MLQIFRIRHIVQSNGTSIRICSYKVVKQYIEASKLHFDVSKRSGVRSGEREAGRILQHTSQMARIISSFRKVRPSVWQTMN